MAPNRIFAAYSSVLQTSHPTKIVQRNLQVASFIYFNKPTMRARRKVRKFLLPNLKYRLASLGRDALILVATTVAHSVSKSDHTACEESSLCPFE